MLKMEVSGFSSKGANQNLFQFKNMNFEITKKIANEKQTGLGPNADTRAPKRLVPE